MAEGVLRAMMVYGGQMHWYYLFVAVVTGLVVADFVEWMVTA